MFSKPCSIWSFSPYHKSPEKFSPWNTRNLAAEVTFSDTEKSPPPKNWPGRVRCRNKRGYIASRIFPKGWHDLAYWIHQAAKPKLNFTNNIFRYFSVPSVASCIGKWKKFPIIDSIRQPHGIDLPLPDAAPMHGFFLNLQIYHKFSRQI